MAEAIRTELPMTVDAPAPINHSGATELEKVALKLQDLLSGRFFQNEHFNNKNEMNSLQDKIRAQEDLVRGLQQSHQSHQDSGRIAQEMRVGQMMDTFMNQMASRDRTFSDTLKQLHLDNAKPVIAPTPVPVVDPSHSSKLQTLENMIQGLQNNQLNKSDILDFFTKQSEHLTKLSSQQPAITISPSFAPSFTPSYSPRSEVNPSIAPTISPSNEGNPSYAPTFENRPENKSDINPQFTANPSSQIDPSITANPSNSSTSNPTNTASPTYAYSPSNVSNPTNTASPSNVASSGGPSLPPGGSSPFDGHGQQYVPVHSSFSGQYVPRAREPGVIAAQFRNKTDNEMASDPFPQVGGPPRGEINDPGAADQAMRGPPAPPPPPPAPPMDASGTVWAGRTKVVAPTSGRTPISTRDALYEELKSGVVLRPTVIPTYVPPILKTSVASAPVMFKKHHVNQLPKPAEEPPAMYEKEKDTVAADIAGIAHDLANVAPKIDVAPIAEQAQAQAPEVFRMVERPREIIPLARGDEKKNRPATAEQEYDAKELGRNMASARFGHQAEAPFVFGKHQQPSDLMQRIGKAKAVELTEGVFGQQRPSDLMRRLGKAKGIELAESSFGDVHGYEGKMRHGRVHPSAMPYAMGSEIEKIRERIREQPEVASSFHPIKSITTEDISRLGFPSYPRQQMEDDLENIRERSMWMTTSANAPAPRLHLPSFHAEPGMMGPPSEIPLPRKMPQVVVEEAPEEIRLRKPIRAYRTTRQEGYPLVTYGDGNGAPGLDLKSGQTYDRAGETDSGFKRDSSGFDQEEFGMEPKRRRTRAPFLQSVPEKFNFSESLLAIPDTTPDASLNIAETGQVPIFDDEPGEADHFFEASDEVGFGSSVKYFPDEHGHYLESKEYLGEDKRSLFGDIVDHLKPATVVNQIMRIKNRHVHPKVHQQILDHMAFQKTPPAEALRTALNAIHTDHDTEYEDSEDSKRTKELMHGITYTHSKPHVREIAGHWAKNPPFQISKNKMHVKIKNGALMPVEMTLNQLFKAIEEDDVSLFTDILMPHVLRMSLDKHVPEKYRTLLARIYELTQEVPEIILPHPHDNKRILEIFNGGGSSFGGR